TEEIGQLAAGMLPKRSIRHPDLRSAIEWLKKGSKADRRVIAAEKETLELESKKHGLKTLNAPELDGLDLKLCFAAHLDEPNLINAINKTLKLANIAIGKVISKNSS